jgi:Glycosyltransferase family 87
VPLVDRKMTILAGARTRRNLWFAYLALILCWGLSTYSQLFQYFQNGTLFGPVINGSLVVNDFVLWYNASLMASQCAVSPIDIYNPDLQQQGIIALMQPLKPDSIWYLQYPPQFFALVKPMAGLGLANAWLVWCGISLVLILLGLWFLTEEMRQDKFARAFLILATLCSHPTWFAFENGQTTLFHFPVLICYWLLLRSKKYFLAGLVSFIFLIKLQYLPFLLPIGFVLGRLKYLSGFMISASLLFLYTLSVVGWNNIISYPKALGFIETHGNGVASPIMQNFKGQLLIFMGDSHTLHLITAAIYGVGVILVLAIWLWLLPRLVRAAERRAFEIAASLSTLIMLICSPHTHMQDYMTVAIAAAFLYPLMKTADPSNRTMGLVKWLFYIFPAYSWVTVLLFVVCVRLRFQPYFLWDVILLLVLSLEVSKRLQAKRQIEENLGVP